MRRNQRNPSPFITYQRSRIDFLRKIPPARLLLWIWNLFFENLCTTSAFKIFKQKAWFYGKIDGSVWFSKKLLA
jgi:hypothetical protein